MHRILIVEDDVILAELLRSALVKHGHRVYHCLDAETAFKSHRKSRLDAILLDVQLPRMSGLELLRMIRSESQIPVILMSGRWTAANRALALKLGAHQCLIKPIKLRELEFAVRQALDTAAV